MNYEKAWKELKNIINQNSQEEFDDIPQWIYQTVLNNMEELEKEYDEKYSCIKDYSKFGCKYFSEDKRYEVVDQDRYYVYVESDRMGLHKEVEVVSFTYAEFRKYFKGNKEVTV